jgi:hypothetical protein
MKIDGRKETVVRLNQSEKDLIMAATEKSRIWLVAELRKMGASEEFFNVFNNFDFLSSSDCVASRIGGAIHGDGIVFSLDHRNLIKAAKEIERKLGKLGHDRPQGVIVPFPVRFESLDPEDQQRLIEYHQHRKQSRQANGGDNLGTWDDLSTEGQYKI